MIHVFIGTKAQLIKMAPVMLELQQRDIPYNFIFSGQHRATVHNIRQEFGLKAPDVTLYSGPDITGMGQMLLWSLRIVYFALRHRDTVWQADRDGVVLNHGDTFSTLLGSLLARLAGLRSAHVESGLRSFRLLHPFPEEITRLLTFRLSNIFYAPGEWALANLNQYSGTKVNTVHNTLLDALNISKAAIGQASVDIPDQPFGVVSIHRFENIFSRARLTEIVGLLQRISVQRHLLFILHKPTLEKLRQYGLMSALENCGAIELRPRYTYFEFIKLIGSADFVITDGGSNQEECHYLGKPCIILRQASERQEGLGGNAAICGYDYRKITQILDNLDDYALEPANPAPSPAKIIVDSLVE